jgi:DNA helicase IV
VREGYLKDLLNVLAGELAKALHSEVTADNREDLLEELRDSRDVRRELNLTWMPVTPEQLVRDLFASPELLDACAPNLTPSERALLWRDRDAAWTVADVPLLDEAAELVGDDETATRLAAAREAAQRAERIANAQAALANVDSLIRPTAEQLAERFADAGPYLTVAERAEADRAWAYGHIVVDEAQELSPMAWRVLMRRCPSRSMTLVGDVAQVGAAAGTSSWGAVLDPYVRDRWRLESLTVNYRTPAAIMQVASDVLAGAGISAPTPESVRDGAFPPVLTRIPGGLEPGDTGALAAVTAAISAALGLLGEGRLAVLAAAESVEAVRTGLRSGLPHGVLGEGRNALESPVVVLGVADAKGLEFDAVVVLEPMAILKASPRGANDLYVALTRPTQRLHVLASGDLPAGMENLSPA